MQTITVENPFSLGNSIHAAAKEAQEMAVFQNAIMEFKFNHCTCRVSATTNLEAFVRDFMNSYEMDWTEIGPDCVAEYSPELQQQIEDKKAASEKKRAEDAAEYDRQEQLKQAAIDEKLKGIELELADPAFMQNQEEINQDPYGGAVVAYAKQWGKLMQLEINAGKPLPEIAQATSHEADTVGLTGFMYGCAVSILCKCWVHGEALRKWHNKEYGHEGDGVVNPAVLTIG